MNTRQTLLVLAVMALLLALVPAWALAYDSNDIAAVKGIATNIGLSLADPDDPTTWAQSLLYVTWSTDPTPRLIEFRIDNVPGLTGMLDAGGLSSLESLNCFATGITGVDVSRNSALTYLNISYTPINSLVVSQNPALEYLDISHTGISLLDVSQNPALETLDCTGSRVSALALSRNAGLQRLYCSETPLSSLDVSNLFSLVEVQCQNSNIATLSLGGCTSLAAVAFSGNPLVTLTTQAGNLVRVSSVGNGTAIIADYTLGTAMVSLAAAPAAGAGFLGWTALSPYGLAFAPNAATRNVTFIAAQNSSVQAGFTAAAPNPPAPLPQRPQSPLPQTGDGFPLYIMLALLGALAVAGGYAGVRLRRSSHFKKT